MARLLSLYERIRNWFLVLIGLLIGVQIGVQPTNASATQPAPAIPERVASSPQPHAGTPEEPCGCREEE